FPYTTLFRSCNLLCVFKDIWLRVAIHLLKKEEDLNSIRIFCSVGFHNFCRKIKRYLEMDLFSIRLDREAPVLFIVKYFLLYEQFTMEHVQRSEERRVGKECRIQERAYQAEDGIRDRNVTGVQTCALPI